ncbi:MAG: serine/threonine kinase family protein, partial [Myxococcales bacterium]|nr:serine/threonine kinase family protein [Myxococcales bacterium]
MTQTVVWGLSTPRAMPALPADPPAPSSSGVVLERGQAIDRFVVLGLVGRGGMGEVYAAYDPELDRKVAIKLLRARDGAAEGRTRLLREAQAIAKLQHPNVVVVYDVGTFGENVFIAMEFVDGRTLGGWMAAGVRSRREILEVFFSAARGLAAAHAAGLVHRDFKPDNVMVTNDGQVRVMDFGLARQAGVAGDVENDASGASAAVAAPAELGVETFDPSVDPDATLDIVKGSRKSLQTTSGKYLSIKLTQTGAMVGTPAYMAPEQFAMRATDARTDQFSFCVALYEALYGERPFAGDSFPTLMTSVVTGIVREPSSKSKVPGWMRRVLLRGLHTEPERRFSSMNALLVALDKDPTVRGKRIVLGAGLLAALVVALLGVRRVSGTHEALCRGGDERWAGVWAAGGASTPRKDAIHHAFTATGKGFAEQAFAGVARALDAYVGKWVAMYQDTCEATRVRGEQSTEVLDLRMSCLQDTLGKTRALVDVLDHADGQVVENAISASGSLPRLERCADVALLKMVVQPPTDEVTRKRVETLRGEAARLDALIEAGRCTESEALAESLIPRVRAAAYLPLVADVMNSAGHLSDACVDVLLGTERYKEAYIAALASRHDEAAAKAAIILGSFYVDRLGQLAVGKEWANVGRAMLQRFGNHPVLDGWLMDVDGEVLLKEGRIDEGIATYEALTTMRAKVMGKDDYHTAMGANSQANALVVAKRYDEAIEMFRFALGGVRRALGDRHPLVAMVTANSGEALNARGRYPEARAAFQTALEVWRGAGSTPLFLSFGLTGTGLAFLGEGRPVDAIKPLEEGLTMRLESHMGVDAVNETRLLLARALWARPADRARALALAR